MKLIRLAIVVWLMGIISHCSVAQVIPDSKLFEKNLEQGKELSERSLFKEAIDHFKKALLHNENTGNEFVVNHLLSKAYSELGQLDSAILFSQKNIDLSHSQSIVVKYPEQVSESYLLLARIYSSKNQLQESESAFQAAIDIMAKYELDQELLAYTYIQLGINFWRKQEFDEAFDMHVKARDLVKDRASKKAEQYFLKAQYELGMTLWEQGDPVGAIPYFKKSIHTSAKKHEGFIADYLTAHSNLSYIYNEMREYDTALVYNQMAYDGLELVENHSAHKSLIPYYKINLLQWRSGVFRNMGNYKQEAYNLNKALKLRISIQGENHVAVAGVYFGLAANAYSSGEFSKALEYQKKALTIRKERYGNGPQMTFIYNDIGDSYRALGMYDSALIHYDSALNFNKKAIIGKEQIYLEPDPAFHSFEGIAQSLQKVKGQIDINTRFDDLFNQFIVQVDFVHDKTSGSFIKRRMQDLFDFFYKEYFNRYQKTSEPKYLDKLWLLTELNKSRKLAIHATHKEGMKSLIEKEYLIKESQLRDSISFYMNKSAYQDNDQITYDSSLLSLSLQYDELIKELELKYPKYKSLKFDSDIITLTEVQQNLKQDEAIIEYYVGKDHVYAFAITQQAIKITTFNKRSDFKDYITHFRKVISKENKEESEGIHYQTLIDISSELYDEYVKEVLKGLSTEIKRITIMPDAELNFIPFEVLLTSKSDSHIKDYRSLPYLIKKYAIHYAYSSTLLFEETSYGGIEPTKGLVTFAPNYNGIAYDSSQRRSLKGFENKITDLEWNTKETNNVANFMNGTEYIDNRASERYFKENVKDHSVIHLAMHAFVDDSNPMQSKLIFSPVKDSLEDGFLNAYELYNMDLAAELVVLSACETGYGKYEYGEGVMSLGRAFSFAGCPSTVTSHWSVDDASTANLMTYFYEFLAEGLSKDKALRQAKLKYLDHEIALYTHPFYWAGFVLIGDTKPIKTKSSGNEWLYFLLIIGCFGVIAFVFNKKNV